MKRTTANLAFACLLIAMFTAESAWYIPTSLLLLFALLMWVESRSKP